MYAHRTVWTYLVFNVFQCSLMGKHVLARQTQAERTAYPFHLFFAQQSLIIQIRALIHLEYELYPVEGCHRGEEGGAILSAEDQGALFHERLGDTARHRCLDLRGFQFKFGSSDLDPRELKRSPRGGKSLSALV